MEKPVMIMTVGLPGSGKSTHVKEFAMQYNANIHSSDNLREEMLNDVNNQDKNADIFAELHRRIKEDLKKGNNVIYDACNVNYKRRMSFLRELSKIECEKICVIVATPYEQCLKQNKLRDRIVPEHVIKKMYLQIDIPAYFEGWDKIYLTYNNPLRYDECKLFSELDNIDQCNPHHTYSIGIHCRICAKNIENHFGDIKNKNDLNLLIAGLFHDIGKNFTKQFKNAKGEDTEFAHYYNHEHVSAYDTLFCLYEKALATINILDICQLIRWHMQLFHINGSEKAKNKFIKLVGQEFYDRLLILHEADKKAH